jgi:hypothetical protein
MMALLVKCSEGHSYVAPDIIVGELPEGAPTCPECYKEWETRQPSDPPWSLEVVRDFLEDTSLRSFYHRAFLKDAGEDRLAAWLWAIDMMCNQAYRDFHEVMDSAVSCKEE